MCVCAHKIRGMWFGGQCHAPVWSSAQGHLQGMGCRIRVCGVCAHNIGVCGLGGEHWSTIFVKKHRLIMIFVPRKSFTAV